jgi:hypothetical protein
MHGVAWAHEQVRMQCAMTASVKRKVFRLANHKTLAKLPSRRGPVRPARSTINAHGYLRDGTNA